MCVCVFVCVCVCVCSVCVCIMMATGSITPGLLKVFGFLQQHGSKPLLPWCSHLEAAYLARQPWAWPNHCAALECLLPTEGSCSGSAFVGAWVAVTPGWVGDAAAGAMH